MAIVIAMVMAMVMFMVTVMVIMSLEVVVFADRPDDYHNDET